MRRVKPVTKTLAAKDVAVELMVAAQMIDVYDGGSEALREWRSAAEKLKRVDREQVREELGKSDAEGLLELVEADEMDLVREVKWLFWQASIANSPSGAGAQSYYRDVEAGLIPMLPELGGQG